MSITIPMGLWPQYIYSYRIVTNKPVFQIIGLPDIQHTSMQTFQYIKVECHQIKNPHKCEGFLSGYQDSNLGPPAPKAGALTGLRYTPNYTKFASYRIFSCGERGIRTLGTVLPVRQFSKLVVSASHPSLQTGRKNFFRLSPRQGSANIKKFDDLLYFYGNNNIWQKDGILLIVFDPK